MIDWVVASIMAIKLKDIPALFGRWGAQSKCAVLPSRKDTPPRPAPDLPLKTLCGSPFEDFAVIATRPPRPDEVSGLSARVPAGLAKFPKAEN